MTTKHEDPEWIQEKMFDEEFDSPIIDPTYQYMESRGLIAPLGECEYCDNQRENGSTFFPSHKAYSFCRSYPGGRNHCTCDSCF